MTYPVPSVSVKRFISLRPIPSGLSVDVATVNGPVGVLLYATYAIEFGYVIILCAHITYLPVELL